MQFFISELVKDTYNDLPLFQRTPSTVWISIIPSIPSNAVITCGVWSTVLSSKLKQLWGASNSYVFVKKCFEFIFIESSDFTLQNLKKSLTLSFFPFLQPPPLFFLEANTAHQLQQDNNITFKYGFIGPVTLLSLVKLTFFSSIP